MLKTCQQLLLDQQKKGCILTNNQYKKSGLKKNDCLKSFDAKISGLVKGWVFAKVAFGEVGHQDNVLVRHMTLLNGLTNMVKMINCI